MIKESTIVTKWNSKTKKYYESLGYSFDKMGNPLEIKIEDLPRRSGEKIVVICDYCTKEYEIIWSARMARIDSSLIKKDCCFSCQPKKTKETMIEKYGVSNVMQVEEFFERQRDSCFASLGVRNPFQSENIKRRIVEDNLEKYGVPSYSKTRECQDKKRKTNLERYGFESHMQTPKHRQMFTGENSPVWKGGIHDIRWDRLQPRYRQWRFEVFLRDGFLCVKCKQKSKKLESHHIKNWNDYSELRYVLGNGITFCQTCHINFHRKYGKYKNDEVQLEEFLQKR